MKSIHSDLALPERPQLVDAGEDVARVDRSRRIVTLWEHRRFLIKVGVVALALAGLIAFTIPKRYESVVRIMPPEQQEGAAAMLATLSSRAIPTGMGALAGALLGIKNTGAILVDLLQSRTVLERIVDRFELQNIYRQRYREDTLKKLAARTEGRRDRNSGAISLVVAETERTRSP